MFLLFPQLPGGMGFVVAELNQIACNILRLPATSAAVEHRLAATHVHTVKRNSLSNKKAAKVVFVS